MARTSPTRPSNESSFPRKTGVETHTVVSKPDLSRGERKPRRVRVPFF